MVIIKLMGGLGNQMFKYAAGRRLAYRLKAQLKLDVHGFEHDPLRKYGLHCLNIQEVFATTTEISMFFALKKPQNFSNMFSRFLGMTSSYVVIRENLFLSFSPEVLTATGNIYLDGYWQSEKYFADIAPLIKQEFTITSPLTKKNQEMLDKIHNTDSIGVHIRRGDYVTNPLTNQIHGTCSREYYIDSINLISKRVPHPYYFVFSDDSQ